MSSSALSISRSIMAAPMACMTNASAPDSVETRRWSASNAVPMVPQTRYASRHPAMYRASVPHMGRRIPPETMASSEMPKRRHTHFGRPTASACLFRRTTRSMSWPSGMRLPMRRYRDISAMLTDRDGAPPSHGILAAGCTGWPSAIALSYAPSPFFIRCAIIARMARQREIGATLPSP